MVSLSTCLSMRQRGSRRRQWPTCVRVSRNHVKHTKKRRDTSQTKPAKGVTAYTHLAANVRFAYASWGTASNPRSNYLLPARKLFLTSITETFRVYCMSTKEQRSEAARLMGQRSYQARLKRFGLERLQEIARANGRKSKGRPPKAK